MKKIIIALVLTLVTLGAIAQQNGGDIGNIKLKNSAGTKDDIWRFGHSSMVYDSLGYYYWSAIKLKTDSIYTKLNTGLTLSGIVKKTLATQVVSSDTGLVVNAVIHGLTTGDGGGYVDVKVNPSGALTVDATVDSTTQRNTIKVSELPAITGTVTANAGTNLNTSLLALASKQPAIAPAGTPSADVLSIQGVSGMTAVKVDGSAVTQPVSISVPATIYNGKKTVTTAGSRVTLASSQACKSVCVKALQTNSGYIYVGDSFVSSTTGFQLLPGDTISLDISNLNTVTIDSSVSGDGVTYITSN